MYGNKFADRANQVNFGQNAALITPDDLIEFEGGINVVCYDGTVLRIVTAGGQTLDHPVVAGLAIPVLVKKVLATGSDATQVVGYW